MRHRTIALTAASTLLVGAAALPATAAVGDPDLGALDIRATVTWDDGDPATADEPLVLEATGVTPSGEGYELTPEDVVSNPSELCAAVGVDFFPEVDGVIVGGYGGGEECLASSVVVEITSDELDQWVTLVDFLGLVEGDGEPVPGAELETVLTADGVTMTWTPLGDATDFHPVGLALFGYVTESPFPDVATHNAFAWHIQFLAASQFADGYEDGTYRPTAPVSRQAMAAFLYRLDGEPEFEAPEVSPFVDVATDHPFYTEIAWLHAEEIATGTVVDGEAWFRPTAPVSRQAAAAFLHRMDEGVPVITTHAADVVAESPFEDVAPGHPIYDDVVWLAESGISTGTVTPDGTFFRPTDAVSRQAMAAFLVRFQMRFPLYAATQDGGPATTLESILG